ncbi:MAG: calcium/sodium antiporter [Candidatus Moranbacteria bacterium]|nr:calcium/sodium antiporter [Candidatus Moranbacteria bacterium]
MVFFWIIVFSLTLTLMIKGADWFLDSAEKIGLSFGLSPFIVGVTIVGMGTSFPELFASLMAVFENTNEIVVSNVVGSNVSNILLIIGFSAIAGSGLAVTKNLIDLDLPMLVAATVMFLGVSYDGIITVGESVLLVLAYLVYFMYTIFHKETIREKDSVSKKDITSELNTKAHQQLTKKITISWKDYAWLVIGILCLIFGAKFMIQSVIALSEMFKISPALISITAIAIGTSLPELIVSLKAARSGKSEVAIGNIFGSNAFNSLIVVGIPGLFGTLAIDEQTFWIGIPTMLVATIMFTISGISKKIHKWEGAMYLMIYILFIGKIIGFL